MEQKSISLSTFFLIILLTAVIVMGILIGKINAEKKSAEVKVEELTAEVGRLEKEAKTLQDKIDEVSNTIDNINSAKEIPLNTSLSETEKREIFAKITEKKELLQQMVISKNFTNPKFTDAEIVKLLPILEESAFTKEYKVSGTNLKANINDVQNLAVKYFGRTINANSIIEQIDNDDNVVIQAETGYGAVNYELVSIGNGSNTNEYKVKINYIEGDDSTINTGNSETVTPPSYILTVSYNGKEIKYLSIEK